MSTKFLRVKRVNLSNSAVEGEDSGQGGSEPAGVTDALMFVIFSTKCFINLRTHSPLQKWLGQVLVMVLKKKISSYVLCEATWQEKQVSLTHLTAGVNKDYSSLLQSFWTEVETFPIKIQLFYFISFLFHLSKVLGWRDGMTLLFTGAIWSRVVLVLNWFTILIYIVAHSYITMSTEGSNKVCLEQWIADMLFISNKTILRSEIKSVNNSRFRVTPR